MGRPLVVASHRQPGPEAFAVSLGGATRCSASARMRRGRTRRRSVHQFHDTRRIALAAVAALVLLTVASLASAYLAVQHSRESSSRELALEARRIGSCASHCRRLSLFKAVNQLERRTIDLRLRHEAKRLAVGNDCVGIFDTVPVEAADAVPYRMAKCRRRPIFTVPVRRLRSINRRARQGRRMWRCRRIGRQA